jgi:hypothetical protein
MKKDSYENNCLFFWLDTINKLYYFKHLNKEYSYE